MIRATGDRLFVNKDEAASAECCDKTGRHETSRCSDEFIEGDALIQYDVQGGTGTRIAHQ